MSLIIKNEIGTFDHRELCGWGVWSEHNEFLEQETRQAVAAHIADRLRNPAKYPNLYGSLLIKGAGPPQRTFLFETARKLFGKDLDDFPQEVGDCFPPGTMVLMTDGSEKPIEQVVPGDWVQSHLGNGCRVTMVITKGYSGDLVGVKSRASNRWVHATPDHRFVKVGEPGDYQYSWKSCSELTTVYDRLLMPAIQSHYADDAEMVSLGFSTKVDAMVACQGTKQVYCLEVEEDHSFIANGYAVSNCVSFGAKHAGEYVQLYPLANGERIDFKYFFPPYLWGMGRLAPDCGNNQLRRQDGSMGAWQAKACMEYGFLPLDAKASDGSTLPAYSGKVARQWGNKPGPDQKWIDLGKQHVVKSAAQVKSTDDVLLALNNGYPVTIASNCGFTMTQQADGFHHRKGVWGHMMCIIGGHPGTSKVKPHFCIRNNWGDVHGTVIDWETGEAWPKGTLRVTPESVNEILSQDDSYAYSSLEGFPAQTLPRESFDPW